MLKRFSLELAAAVALPAWGPMVALETGEAHERRVVRAEVALEMCLGSLRSASDSVLPLPEHSVPPVVDGDPGEPFWGEASLFLWETVGDSAFREPSPWRISIARSGGSLFIAGERREPPAGPEVLSIDGSLRERLVVRLEPDGGASARVEWAGSTDPVARHGGKFAGRTGPRGSAFELEVPPSFLERAGPRGPFRLTSSRGKPAAVLVSPRLRLEPDQVALRMLGTTIGENRSVVARVEVLNLTGGPLTVELSPGKRVEIEGRGRRVLDQPLVALSGPGAVRADFACAGRPVPYRWGLPTLFADGDRLRREAGEVLDRAAENLGRRPAGEAGSAGVLEEIGRLRKALSAARGNQRALEELYLDARALRRRSVLSALPVELREILITRRYHYRYGPYYTTYLHDMPGGNLTVLSLASGEERDLLAMPPGASVRDPSLGFDGRRVVFSLRRPGSGANLYSVDMDGGGLRRITEGPDHDIEPCWLAGGEIIFGSTRPGARNPLNDTDNLCLHRVKEDGTGLRRVSFNYLVDFTPQAMPDGSVVFMRWVHEDKPGNFTNALWTMNPDGSRLAGFLGMNRPGVLLEPQPIPGTPRVVCLDTGPMGHWRDPQVGDIAVFDANHDRNRDLYLIRADRGGYKNPFPVGPEAFLAAHGAPDTRWGIYLVDRWGNREPLYRDLELSAFNPLPVLPRKEPARLFPAGNPAGNAASRKATVMIEDVYRGLPGVERGSVKRLRVVAVGEKPPGAVSGEGFLDQRTPVSVIARMVRRSLGTVPIHADGSAFFHAPPETSLFFQVLDGEGRMVQTMRDTVAFSAGEIRSCIGCHEPRSSAPPSGSRGRKIALDGPPAEIEPEAGPPAIRFPRDIQPILDRRCGKCHDAADPAARVILSGDLTPFFSLAYETLTRGGLNQNNQNWGPRSLGRGAPDEEVAPGSPLAAAVAYVTDPVLPLRSGSRTSRLLALIESGHQGVEVPPDERALLRRWIDLNLPYYDDWELTRTGGPRGERRVLSRAAETTIRGVLRASCRGCHAPPDLHRGAVLSLTRPALSPLLRAPLSAGAAGGGGWGLCAGGVFPDAGAPGYRAILDALEGDRRRLEAGRPEVEKR